MDLQALKTILLVRDLGSLAAAARALDLDASNVSRTVSSIERELGQRLFQRSTRKLSLTEAGEAYLQRVAPLVEEIEAANEDIAARSQQPRGTLRMTASVAFVLEGIVPLLPVFHDRYPDISVELFPSDSNLDLLAEGLTLLSAWLRRRKAISFPQSCCKPITGWWPRRTILKGKGIRKCRVT